MNIGPFYIDTALAAQFFSGRPGKEVIIDVVGLFGWVIIASLLLYVGIFFLEEYKEHIYTHTWKWVLLAIDIPALNVQTPKAVEQLFSHLGGALSKPNIAAKFYHGYKQRWFSFEIISIDGYIQFLIRTEDIFRDLVEAAIYAQYPDAEIVEVEDYVTQLPDKYPNETHDIWAADFGLSENNAYPIRSYREFEHNISKDTVLKDPMGTFLESFTRIGPGEQMWFQILIEPADTHWKEEAMEKIKEVIGDTSGHDHEGNVVIDTIADAPMKLLEQIGDAIFNREPSEAHEEEHVEPNQIKYLTPGQTKLVEAMEDKISKMGFKTKIRAIYVARKEVFRPERGVNAMIGAIHQFNVLNSNSIVPTFGVNLSYFFKQRRIAERKNLLMKAYKKRKIKAGGNPFYFNIEELATIWHFPMSHVKTPLVQKATGKKAEPPMGLPIETEPSELSRAEELQTSNPPTNSPPDGQFPAGTQFG